MYLFKFRPNSPFYAAETGAAGGEGGASGTGEGAGGGTGAAPGAENPPGGTNGAGEGQNGSQGQEKPLTMEDVQRMLQSETDKVRTEYSKKLSQAEKELEALRLAQMDEKQKRDYEIEKRERALREKELLILKNEVELTATNELAAHELPLAFKPFVAGESVEETKELTKQLSELWKKALDEEVEKRFAQGGRIPPKAGAGAKKTGSSMNDIIRQAARR